jgi:hypothetical protein
MQNPGMINVNMRPIIPMMNMPRPMNMPNIRPIFPQNMPQVPKPESQDNIDDIEIENNN